MVMKVVKVGACALVGEAVGIRMEAKNVSPSSKPALVSGAFPKFSKAGVKHPPFFMPMVLFQAQ